MGKDGVGTSILIPILTLSATGLVAAAMRYLHQKRSIKGDGFSPKIKLTPSGRVDELESFADYVARQIGFEDAKECPNLGKLSYDYIKKLKGCEDNIYTFFANDPNLGPMCQKLIDELDKCILSYFGFHWSHATLMISQVLNADSKPKKKFKNIVIEATRKARFERISKDLKVTRFFSTLVEEMKAIGTVSDNPQRCTEVMVPAARSERSPVLLLMGGGMGAGKSTVLKDIRNESFWSGTEAVVVEADAFKETDVIYQALSSRGLHHDMIQTAELVHQSSLDAASSLLVTALNEGRDVIMDGTLSWEPFVEQTIAMARSVHQRRYRMGVGYKVEEDGTVTENYWEPMEDWRPNEKCTPRKPYRIELVGVMCDAYLAVVRGIRRAIVMGRAVRINSQLKSHKRFASAFPRYCQLVDHARLYSTNNIGSQPKLIAWKDGSSNLLVDADEIGCLKKVTSLNEEADSVYELYPQALEETCGFTGVWEKCVISSAGRAELQKELKLAIEDIESNESPKLML